ncbi:MAG: putative solute:sodium symporter small subunit [Oleispira sp.]|jgi:putative solute:sodium symporter small subunit
MAFKSEDDAKAYWKENVGIMIKLLVVWFIFSFGCGILFVDELNVIKIGGYKLGFWFAQQGSIYIFVILTFVYAKLMATLDRKYGVDDE